MKNIALMLLAALTLSFGLTACKDESTVASEESTVEVTTEDGTTVEKSVESETTVDEDGTMTKETTVETTVEPDADAAMEAETPEMAPASEETAE